MTETLAALLFAHVLADFALQPARMAANKGRPGWLLLHGAVVLITAWAALGLPTGRAAAILVALTAAHIATDAAKTLSRGGLGPFVADQAAHLAALAGAAALAPGLWASGLWAGQPWLASALALAAGALAATRAGGFAVGLLMRRYDGTDLPRGLPDGGRLIGLLERGLIFTLVLAGQPGGVGFLVAAKSVLRFDAAKETSKAGEYVIIGTLASFGWALVTAYATLLLLSALPPIGIPPAAP